MKRAVLCAVLVMVSVSCLWSVAWPAFGGATEELKQAAMDINTTPETIESLIKAGANVNVKANDGWTPLMSAAGSNINLEVVKVLIKAGANVNAKANDGWTPLMSAAKNYFNPEVVKFLIKAGADIFATDNNGKTVLDYAKTDEIKRILLNATKKKGR